MKKIIPISLSCLAALISLPAFSQADTVDSHWQATEGDGSKWPKVVNFNLYEEDGTMTALIITCLDDSPAILVQDGLIDDDDLTWKERGTDEDVMLSYAFDHDEMKPVRGFLDGLDSSKVFLYPEDKHKFIRDLVASDHVTFDIGPATFDRPDGPVFADFNMSEASEEFGDTLAQCGLDFSS